MPLAVSRLASPGSLCVPCAVQPRPVPPPEHALRPLASNLLSPHRILCCCVLSMTPAPCAAALYFTLATPALSLSAATLHTLLLRPLLECRAAPCACRILSCCVDPCPEALDRALLLLHCASATLNTPCGPAPRPAICSAHRASATLHKHGRRSPARRPVPLRRVLLLGVVGAGFGHDFFYFVGGARELGG